MTSRSLEHWLINHLLGSYYPVIIPNFYIKDWECDVFSLNRSGYTAEYEIKQSKSDYYKDFEKKTPNYHFRERGTKHDLIKQGKRTNRFWFVLPEGMDVEIPEYAGRMDYRLRYDWITFEIKKQAKLLHKNKATEQEKFQMLQRLSMKHYQAIWKLTKNYDKYQLNFKVK